MRALIEFYTQRDYYRFFSYYDGCKLFDRKMMIKPINGEQVEGIPQEKYLRAKWFAWKSLKKALVEFSTANEAKKAFENFEKNPTISNRKVIPKLKDCE